MSLRSLLRFLAVAATACAALALTACGGDDPPPPQQAGTVVGAAGGTVTGPNDAQVVIPAGALAGNVTIAITQSSSGAPAMPSGFVVFGQTFAFTPHGTTFAVPVTITVPFDPSLVPAGRTPALYKTNAQSQWELVANATVNAGNLTAQVSSFSWAANGNLPPAVVPATARLTVTVPVNGTVTSIQAGINCPGVCSEDYALNAVVDLTPIPAPGFSFTGWSGDADCSDGSVFMNSARNCTATFTAAPSASSAKPRIAAGDGFSVAKLANGQLRSWGTDAIGQLGDDAGDMSRDVVGPVDVLVDAQSIAAGPVHTVVVRGNGQVMGWGYNGFGQLGDGTNFTRTVPTVLSNGAANLALPASPLENAANACAGALHTVVRLTTGRLVATGRNIDGQLGDGSNIDQPRPVPVDGGTGSFSADAIACGFDHTVAVVGGRVYTWGGNGTGQLGDGSTTPRNRPGQLLTGPIGVKVIAAGDGYTLAVDGQDNLWAWGSNMNGKLGDGTEVDRPRPVQITSLGGVTAVVATGQFSMALIGGVVYTWGINEVGQLANGSTSPGFRTTLAPAIGLQQTVIVEIAASSAGGSGLDHALAVDVSGNVWSWGYNADGQLGTGSVNALEARPRQVPNINLN